MFHIPEEKLPDCLKDEQRIAVLFAPLRSKTTNPRDWDNKLNSWRNIITIYCKCNDVYSFSLSSLKKLFVRNGKPPTCLKEVLEDMAKTGDIQPLDLFLKTSSKTWTDWATNTLIKTPISWSFNKLKSSLFDPSEDLSYVHKEIIKNKCVELINTITANNLNKIISFPELLKILNKDTDHTSNLKLLLHNLENEDKIHIRSLNNDEHDDDIYLIKFIDGNKTKPITDVDLGIYTLEKNEKVILEHMENLEEEIQNLLHQAKVHLAKGHRQTAKSCLRKKKEIEKRLTKKANALHNVQILIERIKDTHTDAHVLESYKLAINSFNSTIKNTGLSEDSIEDTMLKLGEMLDIHDDIQSSLSKPPLDTTETDSDLEQELAELTKIDEKDLSSQSSGLEEELEKLNLNMPDVPQTSFNSSKAEMSMN